MNKFLKKNWPLIYYPVTLFEDKWWTKAECYEFVSMSFWVPSFVPIDENRHSVGILSRVACSPARHAAPMLPVFPNWEFKVWNPHVFFDGVWNETAKTIKIVMNTAVNLQGWGFYLEAPCFPKVFQQFMGVIHRKLSFNHFRWTRSRIDRAWYPTKIKRKSYEPEKVPVRVVHLHLCNLLGYGMNIVGTNFINKGLCGPNCSFCRLTAFT